MKYQYLFMVDDYGNREEEALLTTLKDEVFPENKIISILERDRKSYCILLSTPIDEIPDDHKGLRFYEMKKGYIPNAFLVYEKSRKQSKNILECIPSFSTPISLPLNQPHSLDCKLQNITNLNYSFCKVRSFSLGTLISKEPLFVMNIHKKNPKNNSNNGYSPNKSNYKDKVPFPSAEKLRAKLEFKGASKVGEYYCVFEFLLEDDYKPRGSKESFILYQTICFRVGYSKPKPIDRFVPKKVVWDGHQRIRISLVEHEYQPEYVNPLGDYLVPTSLRENFQSFSSSSSSPPSPHKRGGGEGLKFNPWNLQGNYQQLYHQLLFLEEIQRDINYSQYDIANRSLSQFSEFYKEENGTTRFCFTDNIFCTIPIQGLSEGRPSLAVFDIVVVWLYQPKKDLQFSGKFGYEYMGRIKHVFGDKIVVEFHSQLAAHQGANFNIRFVAPRIVYRRMHNAIDVFSRSGNWSLILPKEENFPSAAPIVSPHSLPPHTLGVNFDAKQLQCIASIIGSTNGSIPFILQGSFGTGKTVTLFQSLQLLLLYKPESRILLCTRSASALDDYLVRFDQWVCDMDEKKIQLQHNGAKKSSLFDPSDIYCLKAFYSKPFHNLLLSMKHYNTFTTYSPQDQKHLYPTLQLLLSKRLILTTCDSSSLLYALGMPSNYFTHIFIDEAAQIMEPEALIPLSLANPKTSVILTGDPEQIGPRLHAKSSERHHLHRSLMERLVSIYNTQNSGNVNVICNLTENYRIANQIITLPSSIAYHNKLTSKLNQPLIKWYPKVPDIRAPVVFFAVDGENDERSEDSPSFFNMKECYKVCEIINQLFTDISHLKAEDVIVIAPFFKQIVKLRELFKTELSVVGGRGIRVHTPDGVQGLEAKVVILSASRSDFQYALHDRVFDVGLKHRKRLITSITRCSSLLIVVANPQNFCTHDDCYSVMKFANERGVYHIDESPFPTAADVKLLKAKEEEAVKSSVLNYSYSEEDVTFPVNHNFPPIIADKRAVNSNHSVVINEIVELLIDSRILQFQYKTIQKSKKFKYVRFVVEFKCFYNISTLFGSPEDGQCKFKLCDEYQNSFMLTVFVKAQIEAINIDVLNRSIVIGYKQN